jgi:hypothetical protein
MTNDNSGPAFPFTEMHTHGTPYTQWKGMTLRDYFAAHAMPSILAPNPTTGQYPLIGDFDACAKVSYAMADAMLKAREA